MNEQTKPKLLYVDDEPFFTQGYRDALSQSFDVVYLKGVLYGVAAFTKIGDLLCVVLDIMMPPVDFRT